MRMLEAIVGQVNHIAASRPRLRIFQAIRKQLHGLAHVKTKKIFLESYVQEH